MTTPDDKPIWQPLDDNHLTTTPDDNPDDNPRWHPQMTTPDGSSRWQPKLTIQDDNTGWQYRVKHQMTIPDDITKWPPLMTTPDVSHWWQPLMRTTDYSLGWQPLMTFLNDWVVIRDVILGCHLEVVIWGTSSGVDLSDCHRGCHIGLSSRGCHLGYHLGCHLGFSSGLSSGVVIWHFTLPILFIYWKLYLRLFAGLFQNHFGSFCQVR
jgi:hypothetical protein